MHRGQRQAHQQRLALRGSELRDHRQIEHPDLRIQQIRQQTHPEGPTRPAGYTHVDRARLPTGEAAIDHLGTEKHQIARTGEGQYPIGQLRGGQHRGGTRRGHHTPEKHAGADPQRRQKGLPAAAGDRGAQDQRGIHPGHQGHQPGHQGEGKQSGGNSHGSRINRRPINPVQARFNSIAIACPPPMHRLTTA